MEGGKVISYGIGLSAPVWRSNIFTAKVGHVPLSCTVSLRGKSQLVYESFGHR